MVERYTHTPTQRYNIAPGQQAPVILRGGVTCEMRWGLLSPWRGHGGVRPPPIRTAPLNAISLTPVLGRAERCLVRADGVFAKAKLGKGVHVWWIHGATAFAGLATTHKDDGVASFTLVTAPARAAFADYTDLLPVGADEAWLEGGAPINIAWRADEITRYFEDVEHDDERCITPLANPAQGSLF